MTDKQAYVREEAKKPQSRDHTCHWPGCEVQVAPAFWGCSRHWRMLPQRLRSKIWLNYRPGQETTLTPSKEYIEAAKEVQQWIAEQK